MIQTWNFFSRSFKLVEVIICKLVINSTGHDLHDVILRLRKTPTGYATFDSSLPFSSHHLAEQELH